MNDNVILIGMPASGKSTVGVILAKLLAYDFIDTDLLIQRREKSPLSRIIEARGVDGFLEIEESVCLDLESERAVVATGGSVIYGEAAMRHMKAIGCVVYLDVDYDALCRRLTDIRGRGVVLREGQTLRALYDERTALYKRYADITVPEGDGALEDTVAAVCTAYARWREERGGV